MSGKLKILLLSVVPDEQNCFQIEWSLKIVVDWTDGRTTEVHIIILSQKWTEQEWLRLGNIKNRTDYE